MWLVAGSRAVFGRFDPEPGSQEFPSFCNVQARDGQASGRGQQQDGGQGGCDPGKGRDLRQCGQGSPEAAALGATSRFLILMMACVMAAPAQHGT